MFITIRTINILNNFQLALKELFEFNEKFEIVRFHVVKIVLRNKLLCFVNLSKS